MKNNFLILFYFMASSIIGQDIHGKWSLVITDKMHVTIEALVLDITENEMKTYDFDSLMYAHTIKIDSINKIIKRSEGKKASDFVYNMKDSITLTQHVRYQHNRVGNWKITYWDYVKLLPTKINYPIDSILNKQYSLIYPRNLLRPQNNIKLKGILCGEQAMQMIGKDNCSRYRLEKIEDTYFISYQWKKDHRKWTVPIKEINEDHLLLYGVAGKKGFIKLREIREIKKPKTFIQNKF